jgi:hypothetical protein
MLKKSTSSRLRPRATPQNMPRTAPMRKPSVSAASVGRLRQPGRRPPELPDWPFWKSRPAGPWLCFCRESAVILATSAKLKEGRRPTSKAGQSHLGSATSLLPSFPRQREFRGEWRVLGRWIPAGAGMTEERKATVSPNAIALTSKGANRLACRRSARGRPSAVSKGPRSRPFFCAQNQGYTQKTYMSIITNISGFTELRGSQCSMELRIIRYQVRDGHSGRPALR